MSHIHIPDGVLPAWLWISGWIAAIVLVGIASKRSEAAETRRVVPLLGAVSALVLVAMSSEIVPIAYHVNLTVVAGVLLGPWLGVISSFIVVLMMALLGHGGITVVGLNVLVISTEMALGWALVHGLVRVLGRRRIRIASGIATAVTLAITTTMLVGIVALGGSGATGRETGALNPETLTFANPFSHGAVSVGLFSGGEHAGSGGLSVGRFAAVVYTLGPIGWLLEALVTAGILGYVARVRPTLVFAGGLAEERRVVIGDEHGRH